MIKSCINSVIQSYFDENTGRDPLFDKTTNGTHLAALVLAFTQHDLVVSCSPRLMNDIHLCFSDAKSSELHILEM
jgi:hypothetical protein